MSETSIMRYTLPSNGLNVVLWPVARSMRVCVHCSYIGVGSKCETQEKNWGGAHLLEHMIFKGTQQRPGTLISAAKVREVLQTDMLVGVQPYMHPDEARRLIVEKSHPDDVFVNLVSCGVSLNLGESDIDAVARKYGAMLNAFTASSITSYYFLTTKGNVRPFLAILADSMSNLHVTDDHLSSEMKAVLQELKMGCDQPVRTALYEANSLLFPAGTTGHKTTIGNENILARTQASYLREFYSTYYHPHTATVSVVGDFDPATIKQTIAAAFGSIGVDEYACKRQLDAVPIGHKVPPAATKLVRSLANQPFQAKMMSRVHALERAHTCGSTTAYDQLQSVQPLPGPTHRTIYDHVKVPTNIFAFRIPGWGNNNTVRQTVWDGVCELMTGTASARLPSYCGSFVERHKHAGALYFIAQHGGGDNVFATIQEKIAAKVTAHDAARVQRTLQKKYATLRENIKDLADHLVNTMKVNEMPTTPTVSAKEMQDAIDLLRPQCVQRVTVEAPPNAAVAAAVKAHKGVQSSNARTLRQIKKRVTPLDDISSALQLTPAVQCIRETDLALPRLYGTPTKVGFVHPTSALCHFSRSRVGVQRRDVTQFASDLVAKALHYSHSGPHELEANGTSFCMSSDAFSLTEPFHSTRSKQDVRALVKRASSAVDTPSFQQQRQVAVDALKTAQKSALAAAMHHASNAFLRDQHERFTMPEAVEYVKNIGQSEAVDAYNDNMTHSVDVFVQPKRIMSRKDTI